MEQHVVLELNFKIISIKKMKIIFLIIILSLVQASCYNNTLVDPGRLRCNLKIKVYGRDNIPAKSAHISASSGIGVAVADDSTGTNGEFNTQLLEGEYIVWAYIYDGPVYYSASKSIQLISGIDRVCELRPYNNAGKITFAIFDKSKNPIQGIYVDLLSKTFSDGNYTLKDYKAFSYKSAITDAAGKVSFQDLPYYYAFGIVVYKNDSTFYNVQIGYVSEYYQESIYSIDCPF